MSRGKWDGFPRSDRPHVSHSALDCYLRCPEQYRRAYVLKERIPPGIALLKGSSVDAAANLNYEQKVTSREDLPESKLVEAAAAEFDEACSGGVYLAPDELPAKDRVLGQAKDTAIGMTKAFRREIAPRVQPKIVQPWFRIPIPSASHDLLGRIDVADTEDIVRDTKTSGKRKYQEEVDRSDQLTLYALGYRHLTGVRPAGVAMDVLVGTKVPTTQVLTSTRDERDVRVLLNRVNAMIACVQAGAFAPCAIGSWCCSPRYCGYFGSCSYVNYERQAAAADNGGF